MGTHTGSPGNKNMDQRFKTDQAHKVKRDSWQASCLFLPEWRRYCSTCCGGMYLKRNVFNFEVTFCTVIMC
ncbi:hypothetical protein R1flu_002796 [Riccia fluitans]|uniref:Uncharacterized protein n=1 Tax=Riccia fluitans TaxID=41844 RepID=A0ABD1Y7I6_9MARC